MSTEIVKLATPHNEMLDMAKLFSESGMFPDIKSAGMAFVKIQAGKEIGISPFAAMSGIHIIQGKVTIGAGIMAGCVKGSPKYDYLVKEMTEKTCSIDFTAKGGKVLGNSTFTIDDAKKAGTKNMDKHPKNMLFARAMSNGVKWYCPDVFTMPVYTPEDFGTIEQTEDAQHTEIPTPPGTQGEKAEVKQKSKLSAKAYKDALDRIGKGETQLIQMIQDTFDVTDVQLKELTDAAPAVTEVVDPA